jgi:serine phosphatase RsbU (regulator of sigma subunit)
VKDGMDMSMCALDLDTNTLRFAGASNPMYLLRNNQIETIQADKMAIGQQFEGTFNFATKELALRKGDTIYLFSDGFADQFGGPKGKKFKYSRFKELLIDIHKKKMDKQHQILLETMDTWQGSLEQLDDLCVLGYKV